MKVDHIRVGRFSVAEAVKEINARTEGRNCHGIFFNEDGFLNGTIEIYTTEIKTHVIEVEKPRRKISEKYKSHEYKKSKYRGVQWDKLTGKWRTRICVNGKRISLGVYDSELEAAIVYDLQALKSLGNKAKTNFEYTEKGCIINEKEIHSRF